MIPINPIWLRSHGGSTTSSFPKSHSVLYNVGEVAGQRSRINRYFHQHPFCRYCELLAVPSAPCHQSTNEHSFLREDFMPMTGNKKTSSKAGWNDIAKRIVVMATMMVSTIFVLDQLGLRMNSSAQRALRKSQANTIGTDDCTFLKDPEQFRDVQQRHRVAVSRTTEAVSENMEQGASRLVSAGEIPRKNFIDSILFGRMEADSIGSAPLCTDQEFVRRVYLDLTSLS